MHDLVVLAAEVFGQTAPVGLLRYVLLVQIFRMIFQRACDVGCRRVVYELHIGHDGLEPGFPDAGIGACTHAARDEGLTVDNRIYHAGMSFPGTSFKTMRRTGIMHMTFLVLSYKLPMAELWSLVSLHDLAVLNGEHDIEHCSSKVSGNGLSVIRNECNFHTFLL